jgi:hypothetical protein
MYRDESSGRVFDEHPGDGYFLDQVNGDIVPHHIKIPPSMTRHLLLHNFFVD